MFYCERCGEADCCERFDLPTDPVLCDACYEKATREKLIDVFMHIGDHITNRDEYGICFDTPLAKAIEDVLAMLKSQDANGVTLQKWIPVTERLPENRDDVLVCRTWWSETRNPHIGWYNDVSQEWQILDSDGYYPCGKVTHWMPLPEAPKGE